MSKAKVGDIVLYRPAIDDQRFHDNGHREILPAIVTKVWDGVENLQVFTQLDLTVIQDGQIPPTFVPFVRQGTGIGEWSERG
jgi:hypothetical protein